MLSEEEKKAIKYFYNLRSTIDESYMLFDEEINLKCGKEMIKQITLALNLITKLQKENKEKDNQIDLMAEYWFFKEGKDLQLYIGGEGKMMGYLEKKEKVIEIYKQRFEKLVKEEGE